MAMAIKPVLAPWERFLEDCRRARIVVSQLAAPGDCAADLVIDRTFLSAHGATEIHVFLQPGDGRDPDLSVVGSRGHPRFWHDR